MALEVAAYGWLLTMGGAMALFSLIYCARTIVLPEWRAFSFDRSCSRSFRYLCGRSGFSVFGVFGTRSATKSSCVGGGRWTHHRLRTDDVLDEADAAGDDDDCSLVGCRAGEANAKRATSGKGRVYSPDGGGASRSSFGRAGLGLCVSTIATLARLRDGVEGRGHDDDDEEEEDGPSLQKQRPTSVAWPRRATAPPPCTHRSPASAPRLKVTFSVDGGPSRIGMIDVDPIGSTPQLLESLMELGDTLYEPGALVASQCAVWYTTFSGESKRMYVTKTSMADICASSAGLLVVKQERYMFYNDM